MKKEAERKKPLVVDVLQYDRASSIEDALEKIIPIKQMAQQLKINNKPIKPKKR